MTNRIHGNSIIEEDNMYKNNSIYRKGNYIRVANKHIFLNFREENFIDLEEIEGKERQQRIHVFITNHHAINDCLSDLIKIYSDNTSITIHVPQQVRDLKVVIDDYLSKYKKKWKIFVEPNGPIFKANDNTVFKIHYFDNGIQASLSFGAAYYTGYKLPQDNNKKRDKNNEGAITSTPMQMHPELFRDQIIKGFKDHCPEGILKAFDTDDKIWEYIMETGEWNVKQEE